jgi:Uri superfamily endonuclease
MRVLKPVIPATPGVYALQLYLEQPLTLEVGKLGGALFPAGMHIYLGSAWGPGGLRARLKHHISKNPIHPHWHIDYLRRVCKLDGIYFFPQDEKKDKHTFQTTPFECLWAQSLTPLSPARIVLTGFGASDCRSGCLSHLVSFPRTDNQDFTYFHKTFPSLIINKLAVASNISLDEIVFISTGFN